MALRLIYQPSGFGKKTNSKKMPPYMKILMANINYDGKNMPSCIRLTTAKLDWFIGKTSVPIAT